MKKFLSLTAIFIFFLSAAKVLAADISVSTPSAVLTGENFEVSINADSGGVPINSVNIILDYNEDLVSFAGYKESGTVINTWIDSPHEKNGDIYMSGIIPGGVSGLYDPDKKEISAIPLARLQFSAKGNGNAVFSFAKTEIFQNDGKGTPLMHGSTGGEVAIQAGVIPDGGGEVIDGEKPEPFDLTFLESSVFSRTPSMVIFKTNDTGSGIKEYWVRTGGPTWKKTQSPQPISKGFLSRDITVRAFDFSGNFQDSSIRIPGLISPRFFLVVIALLTIFCIWGYKMLKSRI